MQASESLQDLQACVKHAGKGECRKVALANTLLAI